MRVFPVGNYTWSGAGMIPVPLRSIRDRIGNDPYGMVGLMVDITMAGTSGGGLAATVAQLYQWVSAINLRVADVPLFQNIDGYTLMYIIPRFDHGLPVYDGVTALDATTPWARTLHLYIPLANHHDCDDIVDRMHAVSLFQNANLELTLGSATIGTCTLTSATISVSAAVERMSDINLVPAACYQSIDGDLSTMLPAGVYNLLILAPRVGASFAAAANVSSLSLTANAEDIINGVGPDPIIRAFEQYKYERGTAILGGTNWSSDYASVLGLPLIYPNMMRSLNKFRKFVDTNTTQLYNRHSGTATQVRYILRRYEPMTGPNGDRYLSELGVVSPNLVTVVYKTLSKKPIESENVLSAPGLRLIPGKIFSGGPAGNLGRIAPLVKVKE